MTRRLLCPQLSLEVRVGTASRRWGEICLDSRAHTGRRAPDRLRDTIGHLLTAHQGPIPPRKLSSAPAPATSLA